MSCYTAHCLLFIMIDCNPRKFKCHIDLKPHITYNELHIQKLQEDKIKFSLSCYCLHRFSLKFCIRGYSLIT